ncbi:MAG: hypothetical protein MPJ25_11805, partial [Pirellulales bacterium]|nr:hypothetical protein [Pirellulales bacterium]
QIKHFERYLFEQLPHSRAISVGKAPLQRQHFELYLFEQLPQRRAASRGKAPLQLQHRFCATLISKDSFVIPHEGRENATEAKMMAANPMNKQLADLISIHSSRKSQRSIQSIRLNQEYHRADLTALLPVGK